MSFVNLKKRLEIIKMLIQLGDIGKVRPHLFNCSSDVNKFPLNSFLYLLEQKKFDRLIIEIDKILKQIDLKNIDPLESLKKLTTKLKSDIKQLELEKNAIRNQVSAFEKRYHKELGQHVLKVAYYEQMKINNKSHSTYTKKDIINKKPLKNTVTPSRDEFETMLKQQFRKATKLCHPDSNEKANIENIEEKFIQLKNHLRNKNLHAINELIEKLEPYQNQSIIDEETREKYILENEIRELQKVKMRYIDEIEFLKATQSYQTISEVIDMDAYFIEQKQILNQKIDGFKRKFA